MHERGGHIDVGQPCNSPEVLATFLPQTSVFWQQAARVIGQSHPPFVFHFLRCCSSHLGRHSLASANSTGAWQTPSLHSFQANLLGFKLSSTRRLLEHHCQCHNCHVVQEQYHMYHADPQLFLPQRRLFEAIAPFTALLEPPPGWPSLLPISSRQHQRATVRGRRLNFFNDLWAQVAWAASSVASLLHSAMVVGLL